MVLVTGANGRIGNVLVKELLKNNEKVRVLVRKTSNLLSLKGLNIEKVYGDIRDYKAVQRAVAGCKYVYHLAGHINISNKDKKLTFGTNVDGTKNILKACKRMNIKRLVHTSSIHALRAPDDESMIDEKTPLCDKDKTRGLYDQSKAIATREVLNYDLDSVVVCPTGVVGPYDYEPSFFGKGMIESIKRKLKTTISGAYDYVDVRDVVDGMINAMRKGIKKEIYILSGEQIEMREYIKLLQAFTGIRNKIKMLSYKTGKVLASFLNFFSNRSSITPYSVETLISNSNISHAKATRELGYKARKLKDSLFDQYKWFIKNGYL